MKRINYYANVHKALRYALSQLLIEAGRTGNDPNEIEKLRKTAREVFFFLAFHAENENQDLLPALAQFDASIVSRDTEEHHSLDQLAASIQNRLEKFPLAAEESWAWYLDLSAYVAFQFEHMNREERETLPELQRHFSDQEIAAFGARSVSRATPAERTMMLGWMFRALSRAESAEYLEKLKAVVPPEAFGQLEELAIRMANW